MQVRKSGKWRGRGHGTHLLQLPYLRVQRDGLCFQRARARLRQLPRLGRLLVSPPQRPRVVVTARCVIQLPLEVQRL